MVDIPSIFGSLVFNDEVMKARLPKDVYESLHRTIESGTPLELNVARVVADAMKDWAIEKGATHYTHWFQPMTGITAEKHDSFLKPTKDGKVIMKFSENALVHGEPDASSFPNGGLRATFEARGYTAWDPTSYAFIKDDSLCIPTAFCSYGGDTLDKKTPLLRSMDALNKQALRILKLFGNTDVKRVNATVGAEQEYFLIDKKMYETRMDLVHCGRTLFGAKPPKGQEMEDHYFGAIKHRVSEFMKELDVELWKLGVPSKTKHNEAAPAQHELAPVFTTVNLATDQNQLTMELMKSLADKHNLACLLHEKPFANVNGSGKHNNWSISTDTGVNLLEPGETPYENAQFLLFLVAVIKAVDEYQDLLRLSAASAGNDHRLGANEAPPAIVSIFLGDELTEILDAVEKNVSYKGKKKSRFELGAMVLPSFPKDTTDRNRTSSFAFTGNKFEFRMLGSSFSIACTNYIINTIVAEALKGFADKLEKSTDFNKDLGNLVAKTIKEHKRIIYNGNSYSEEWVSEAEKRGLSNLKSTVEALATFTDEKNVKLFESHKILRRAEIESRQEILLESYYKTLNIEALTMLEMAKKQILPAVLMYERKLVKMALHKKQLNMGLDMSVELDMIKKLTDHGKNFYELIDKLDSDLITIKDKHVSIMETATYYRDVILTDMNAMRAVVDELELLVAKDYWPFPTYSDLLYSVK